MRDKFYRQVTGALCLVRGCGDTCMRECGPEPLRIECARRPGSRASIDRPVAGTRWQSARTPNPRGQADREEGSVRAEGAGAHLWDHHDHLQRPGRPPSRQPESLGCRQKVPAKHRTLNLARGQFGGGYGGGLGFLARPIAIHRSYSSSHADHDALVLQHAGRARLWQPRHRPGRRARRHADLRRRAQRVQVVPPGAVLRVAHHEEQEDRR